MQLFSYFSLMMIILLYFHGWHFPPIFFKHDATSGHILSPVLKSNSFSEVSTVNWTVFYLAVSSSPFHPSSFITKEIPFQMDFLFILSAYLFLISSVISIKLFSFIQYMFNCILLSVFLFIFHFLCFFWHLTTHCVSFLFSD